MYYKSINLYEDALKFIKKTFRLNKENVRKTIKKFLSMFNI